MKKMLSLYLHPAGMKLIPPDTPIYNWTGDWPQHPVEVYRPRPDVTEFGGHLVFKVQDFHSFVIPENVAPYIEHVYLRWHREADWNGPYFAHAYHVGEHYAGAFDPTRSSYRGGTSVHLESFSVMDEHGTSVDYKSLDLDIVAPTMEITMSWLKKVEHVRHPKELPPEFRYLGDWHDRLNRMLK